MKGQFPSVFNLSALNGQNGFKLDGENNGDNSGFSVSTAGDINDDGYADLIIGAYYYPGSRQGRSYVVFGGPGVGGNGDIALSSLNGANGFKLDGENNLDYSGWSVSTAGDINGDGHADLIIGDNAYSGVIGRNYVLFGGLGVGSSGDIASSSLNGANGFKLDGENIQGYSGISVSGAGDINGDGYDDLLIGARAYPGGNYTGRSYVVFGGLRVGATGDIPLSNLNGTNGFKLDGENNGDSSGSSVSRAGDINGDGYADLIIGAPGYGGTKGRSYVVFGRQGIGSGGVFNLSSLNGVDGFKLDSETAGDYSGWSVSAAGDINGDGVADLLIGAYSHASTMGRSYVVFGGMNVGSSGVLSLSMLNGSNGFKLDGETSSDASGWSVSAAGDINGDGVADLLIGAYAYLSGSAKGRSYVVFGDVSPQLLVNQLTIGQGKSVILTNQNLNATDNSLVSFMVSNITQGHFEAVNLSGQPITSFNQSAISAQQIRFVHNGSVFPPSYVVQVPNFGIALPPPPQNATITFYRFPVIINNQFSIVRNGTTLITPQEISVNDNYTSDAQVNFIVQAVTNGQFELIPFGNISTSQFTQQQVKTGEIQFHQNDSFLAPSYNLTVSDGLFTEGPFVGALNWTFIPYLPKVINPIPPCYSHVGETINCPVPNNTFADLNGQVEPLTLSATFANGSMLPYPALYFAPETATLTGSINWEESPLNISIKATNQWGLSSQTFFDLTINPNSLSSSGCTAPGLMFRNFKVLVEVFCTK